MGAPPDPLPDVPPALSYLWVWFQELSEARQSGLAANPLTFTEIRSYSEQMRLNIDAWETRTLRRMDTAALATYRGEQAAKRASEQTTSDPNARSQIPIKEVKTIGAMLRGLPRFRPPAKKGS